MAIKISGSTIIDDSRNIVSGAAATFTGNVSIGGTLTYEDVTNIDSVGLITARSGVVVVGGGVSIAAGGLNVTSGITTVGFLTATDVWVSGAVTATTFSGSGANLTGLTGASANTYGDASNVAQIVVNSDGKITGISNVSISGGGGGGGGSSLWESNATGINTSTNVGIGTTTVSDATLIVDVGTASTAVVAQGSEGQLFSVTNSLSSGSIFSVNDISGIPSIDVDADGTIQLAPYSTTENIGLGITNPTSKLHVVGGGNITGVLTVGQIADSNGTVGAASSVLSSTGSGLSWVEQSSGGGGGASGLWASNATGINTSTNVGIGTTTVSDATLVVDVGTASTAVVVQGSEGQLFSVTNSLSSGSIFSVNDISGIPSIDVDADGTIQLAPFSSTEYVGVGTTNPTEKFHVVGDARVTGILTVGTSSLTLDGSNDKIKVGSATTIETTGYRIGDSFVHSTGISAENIVGTALSVSGIATVTDTFKVGTGITASAGIVTVSTIHITGGNFGPIHGGSDDETDAALVLDEGQGIYSLESSGGWLNILLEKQADVITLGQANTNKIDEIKIIPGKSGITQLYAGDGTSTPVGILTTNKDGVTVSGISSVGTAITMYGATGIVSATSFYGSLVGNADSATSATNVAITDDTSGSGTHYIHFGSETSSNDGVEVDSTGLVYKDGNIGIGTDDPTTLLQVGSIESGRLNFDGANTLSITGPEGGAARIDLISDQGDDAADKWRIASTSGNDLKIQRTTSHTDALVIKQTGDVGIGTDNPVGAAALTDNEAVLAVGVATANTLYGKLNNLTYPTANGTDGYVLTSDGAGVVQWEAAGGGGGADVGVSSNTNYIGTGVTNFNFVGTGITASLTAGASANTVANVYIPSATRTTNRYIATADQTTFSATYTVGYVDVFLNGIKLDGQDEFTATNGTSVVLTDGATVNDIVEIVAQQISANLTITGIANVVEDTTPQLGGNLEVNGKDISGTGNVNLTGIVTATTFSGGYTDVDLSGLLKEGVNIVANKLSAVTNTPINLSDGMVHLFTTTEDATATPNIRFDGSTSLNSKMSTGEAITVVIIIAAAAGGYYAQLTIDGSAVTEEWLGGSAPTEGGAGGYDVYTHNIIKTADATFVVLSNLVNFA